MDTNDLVLTVDGIQFSNDQSILLKYPDTFTGEYVVPETVKFIGDKAFENCKGLTGVTLNKSLEGIGCSAFKGCISLTSIMIPISVQYIKEDAFSCCENLQSLTIDYLLIDSINRGFCGSGNVMDAIFGDCPNLKSIYNIYGKPYRNKHVLNMFGLPLPDDAPKFNPIEIDADGNLIIPQWKTTIQAGDILNPEKVKNVCVPSNIKYIYDGTFSGCINLRTLKFEDCVKIYDKSLMLCPVEQVELYAVGYKWDGYIWKPDFSTLKQLILGPKVYFSYLPYLEYCENTLQRVYIQNPMVMIRKIELNCFCNLKDVYIASVEAHKADRKDESKKISLSGVVNLEDVKNITERKYYDTVDLTAAEFGIEEESRSVFLGFSHFGCHTRHVTAKVEVLSSFLKNVHAYTVILPDNVMLRHINVALTNSDIAELVVRDSCPKFSYQDGILYNKKKTKVIF